MPELDRRVLLGAAGVLGAAAMARVAAAGPVDPPAGPVGPTAGPEPRTPIDARNTPGDSTCKFKITSPGSYFLTGDLVGSNGKHGICIALTTPGPVHIDLRGFSLRGVAGALNGIDAGSSSGRINITNGIIILWPGKGIASAAAAALEMALTGLHISYCGDGVAHTYLASCLRSSVTVDGVSVGSCGRGLVFTGTRVDAQDHVNLQKVRVQGCVGNGIHVDHSMERSSSMWDPDMEVIQNGGDGICFTPSMTDSVLFGCKRSLTTSSNGGHGINCSPVAVRSKVAFEFSTIRGVHQTTGAGLTFGGSYTNSSCDIIAHEAEEAFNQTGVRVNPVCDNARINVSFTGIKANGNATSGFLIAPTGTGVCNVRLEGCSGSLNAGGAGAWGVFPTDMNASFQAVDCTFENNAAAGMRTDGAVDVLARNCIYTNNLGGGLLGLTGPREVSVIGCQFSTNAPHGFMFEAAGSGATSMGCFRVDSSVFRRSGAAGIMIASCRGGEIVRCSATSGTIGVYLTSGATGVAIEDCTAANNSATGFSVAGAGNLLLRNNARANGSEPSASYAIAAGNTVGPIISAATIATNTNPHANYVY